MKLKLQLIFLPLLTLLFSFFFTHSAFASTYTLSGSVKDNGGNAIGSATVHVYNVGTTTDVLSSTTTDTQTGNYTFSSVPQGTYDIQVIPPSGSNYSPAIAFSQNIFSNSVLNFILVPSGTVILSGHVYDPLGNPVSNQVVYLENSSGVQVSMVTDSTGKYSLQDLAGTYTLFIQSPSTGNSLSLNVPQFYVLRSANYSITQSTILDIIIPAKKVSIKAQDLISNPVANVMMTANIGGIYTNTVGVYIGGNITNAFVGSHYNSGPKTDSSGNAILWLLPTDSDPNHQYSLVATPPSGSNYSVTTIPSVSITGDTNMAITLQQPLTLTGHIYDPLGNPVSNQVVYLENSSGVQVSMVTDSTGKYSLQDLAGTYTLFIQSPSTGNSLSLNVPQFYVLRSANYSLTQNTTLNITIPAKKVSIHTQDAFNNAIANVGIKASINGIYTSLSISLGGGLTAIGGSYYNSNKLTDSLGNTTLWLLSTDSDPTHLYSLIATPPSVSSYSTTSLSNVTITNDTSIAMTFTKPVIISGHVYDPLGNPVSNQTVYLENPVSNAQVTTTTDTAGSYSLLASTGSYTLFVQSPSSGNSLSLNVPQFYVLRSANYALSQNTVLDITIPAKKVSIHVQSVLNNPVSNVGVKASINGIYTSLNLILGGGISAIGGSYYNSNQYTDNSGNTVLWLLPTDNDPTHLYSLIATSPSGSIYSNFTLNNISVMSDQTELISLQYNHAVPVTSATLSPVANGQGNYSDPTTVTLSATAASGYTIAHTYYTVDGGSQQTYTSPFTVSSNGSHTVTYWSIDNSGVPETANTKTFTIQTTYTLSGTVYNDANQNGFQDSGETGVNGATITLNTNQSVTTDSNGNYSFTGLIPGTYTETLSVPNGDIATTTNPATISLSTNTTQNFGVAPAGPTLVTAINTGGDTQGAYLADTDYTGGQPYSTSTSVETTGVTNPAPQAVYQTVRYGNSFTYTIPNLTPGSNYTVRLHFNELYWNSAGSRVFNVAINGTQVLSNYDIYDKAGGANKAITEQFSATPDSNGNVTIQFSTVTDNAIVNGIELYSGTLPSPTPTPTPVTSAIINAGGSTVGNFQADNSFSGGTVYSSTASVDTSNVTSPAPQAVYQSVRYGNFTYNIQHLVPNTNFLVRLHFNELYWTTAGSREFNVSINGTQVLNNFDIFATAGGVNKAMVEDFVEPSDANGKISIQFSTVADNAMVNGIEIIPATVLQATYYTANDGVNFSRLTSPFVSGVSTQARNADTTVTMNVNNAPGYADSGLVLYEGALGNLPNFTTIGTGDHFGLNIWLDANSNNEFFAWDSNGILSGLDSDTYALSNGSQNGVEQVNGATNFFLMSDGQNHSLADLKNGVVSGINANTKVAVWIGVNTNSGSTSSTIQSVNGL